MVPQRKELIKIACNITWSIAICIASSGWCVSVVARAVKVKHR